MKSEDYIGKRYGTLTVVAFDGLKSFGRGKAAYFTFECDCGARFSAQKSNVGAKAQRGGCRECNPVKHLSAPNGATAHPLYKRWVNMMDRCSNPGCKSFPDYGARGISVCSRWKDGEDGKTGFECFVSDMGPCPAGYTIERLDTEGGYNPGNCCWIPKAAQSANRRSVDLIEIDGVANTLPYWCARFGVKYWTARARLKRGLPLVEVFRPLH